MFLYITAGGLQVDDCIYQGFPLSYLLFLVHALCEHMVLVQKWLMCQLFESNAFTLSTS